MKKGIFLTLACAVAMFATVGQVDASVVYMRSTVAAPWGQTTNEAAMDAAFGGGGWQDLRYETANVASVFSASNSFAFLEGGDSNANELEAFLTANQAAIESWVSAGGSLFVNSAPNEGDGMSYGFGGVSLNYPDFPNEPVTATNAAHPIFVGPLVTAVSFTGNSFAHASVSGGGITSLMEDVDGRVALAEKSYGMGHVMFGGMTTTNFHDPEDLAFNLRVNTLIYGAGQSFDGGGAVPEPSTLVIFSAIAGFAAVGAIRRRRQLK